MSTKSQLSSSYALGWLGLIILAGLFIFKWIPDWTWTPDLPEIKINNYIFESRPTWQGETATIETATNPTIHIRIGPKDAIADRAHLKVTLGDKEVSDDCPNDTDYFCHNIPSGYNPNGTEYQVTAKNDAGETHATIKVIVKPKESKSYSSSSHPTESTPSQTQSTTQTAPTTQTTPSSPSVNSATCLHEVSGTCLDDYGDEAYSAGLYDHEYGRYGTSFDYPDGCNTTCQEALEDAYDEGWYDAGY